MLYWTIQRLAAPPPCPYPALGLWSMPGVLCWVGHSPPPGWCATETLQPQAHFLPLALPSLAQAPIWRNKSQASPCCFPGKSHQSPHSCPVWVVWVILAQVGKGSFHYLKKLAGHSVHHASWAESQVVVQELCGHASRPREGLATPPGSRKV